MKKHGSTLFLLFLAAISFAQKSPSLSSPDGKIQLDISLGDDVRFEVLHEGRQVVAPSAPALILSNGKRLGKSPVLQTVQNRSVRDTIFPPVAIKRKAIPDHFNELTLLFKGFFSLQFRAYDDGVAYRFLTNLPDSVTVVNEVAEFKMDKTAKIWYPQVVKRDGVDIFHTSFEEPYQIKPLDSIAPDVLMFSPVLAEVGNGLRMVLTESDLEDYPGMFLSHLGGGLKGIFAPYPAQTKMTEGEFPAEVVTRRADFIARTVGKRSFPWRVMVLGDDKTLPSTDLVYRLAAPNRLGDVSWIKPGRGTDEWIINIALFNVPFKAGINSATYKYYIDFAKRFGLQRIMLDAGWSDVKDLFKINPDLDMNEIAAYARSQGVGLSLWTLASTLERQLEPALDQFQRWGVDFVMTDFMDRDDQPMVNFYPKIAEACARRNIMVMFHGSFKPAGFERTYPNAITREGVLGSEYNAWSDKATPENNVRTAFIRMVSGSLDYEPGLLDNGTQSTFRPIWGKVMSQGTRCHQLSMFVIYDSPVQIFSGNPSTGWQEPAFMELLGSLPTTWDETLVPAASLGDYVVMARQKGGDWYVAAMNDWTAREISIPLDFLGEGIFEATICADGVNAEKVASDYVISTEVFTRKEALKIGLAPGGGYVARLRRK